MRLRGLAILTLIAACLVPGSSALTAGASHRGRLRGERPAVRPSDRPAHGVRARIHRLGPGADLGQAVQLLPRHPRRAPAHRAQDRARGRDDQHEGDRARPGRRAPDRARDRDLGRRQARPAAPARRDEQHAQPVLRVPRLERQLDEVVPPRVPAHLPDHARRNGGDADREAAGAQDAGRQPGRARQPVSGT